ncbi:MAG: hypothetical protein WA814_01370 [Candidatus Baltobacteraceae bacterium]
MDDDRLNQVRDGVTDADATGMIAGEQLITQAETLLPILPHEDLHQALPEEHSAHGTIDDLKAEVERSAPDREAVEKHVSHLRGLPEVEAVIVNWWDDPRTQRFFGDLGQIGL